MAMEMLLKIWMMMTTMMMKQGKVEIKCNVYFLIILGKGGLLGSYSHIN